MIAFRKGLLGGLFIAGILGTGLTWGQDDKSAPRSPSYGGVMQGNLAVDFTTDDYLIRPHLIGDQQFILGNYSGLFDGIFSIKAMGLNIFAGMNNTARPNDFGTIGPGALFPNARFRMGVANNMFGAGLILELNKSTEEAPAPDPTPNETTHGLGDAYGVFGSLNLGAVSIFADILRESGPNINSEFDEDAVGTSLGTKEVITDINLGVIKDTQGEGNHALGASLGIGLIDAESDPAGTLDESSQLITTLFSHGVPLVYNEDHAVFIGSNLLIYYFTFDDNVANADVTGTGVVASPNITFQKTLGKGFEFQVGGSYAILRYATTTTNTVAGETKTSDISNSVLTIDIVNGPVITPASFGFGLRWKKGNFSLEGQLANAFMLNGPNFIGGGAGPGLFSQIGMGIGF